MKFEHYIKRVEESPEFKKFREDHKKAYLSAGFFVLDFDQGKHIHQIDFFIPGNKKIATFKLEKGVSMQVSDTFKLKTKPEEMIGKSNLDIDALKGIVHDEMMNRTVTQEVKKIIAVLQQQNGKKIWRLNCITNDLGIIKVDVDDEGNVLDFEKANLFDMMKKVK
ncbi:MAG: hypothetical protein KKB21_01965 [Nanoarchaeota archaeon]|nr:hypothetical protein [Nanoarchaeota archaeon]MBU4086320.1 hypothetical protein [Nanoarchaeota archaeon]